MDGCEAGSATERDAIHFALGKKARIVLGSALPPVADPSGLRINGQKASITISGNEQVGVFEVVAGADLRLLRLTVADGNVAVDVAVGGLLNRGTAKVRNTTFSNNSADGGGISNRGTLEVTNSTFSKNSSISFGGGIFNGGTVEVTDSTFSKNSADDGGGIDNNAGTVEVTDSTFSKNNAVSDGGAIFNNFNGPLEVTNSTFSKNIAPSGGGIFDNRGMTTLRNTIVAYSPSGGNCSGTITDDGYNVDDGATCGFSEQQNSLLNTDPLLATKPANNGGPTRTIALLKDSPAIDAIPEGENDCGTEIRTDQRGVKRPQGSGCDIGSFEKKRGRR